MVRTFDSVLYIVLCAGIATHILLTLYHTYMHVVIQLAPAVYIIYIINITV